LDSWSQSRAPSVPKRRNGTQCEKSVRDPIDSQRSQRRTRWDGHPAWGSKPRHRKSPPAVEQPRWQATEEQRPHGPDMGFSMWKAAAWTSVRRPLSYSLTPTQCHIRGIESVHSRRRTTDPFSRIVRSKRTRRCSRLDLISMRVRSSRSRCGIRMRCTSSPIKAALAGRSRCTSQVSISDTSTLRSPIRYESPSRSSYVVSPVVESWVSRLPANGAESRVTASVASSRGSGGGRVGAAPAGGGISGRRRIASLPVRSVVTIENGVGQSMGN
jgi:hypothetical protein